MGADRRVFHSRVHPQRGTKVKPGGSDGVLHWLTREYLYGGIQACITSSYPTKVFYTFYSYVSYHFEPDMEVTYVLEIRHDPSG